MATVPRFRRRGAAIRVMEGLARWASHEGASSAYLQVFEENRSARALYERLGFAELYVYHYRVERWSA
jgi:GNAT superfamily N-acetyltransferase